MDPEQYGGQPPVPETFTQADTIRLAKLQAGLSSAQEQLDNGELHPEEFHQLAGTIQGMLAPLQQKQQRASQQAQQQQQAEAQQQAAMAAAMQHSDAVYRAKGFQDLVSTYTDPLTGKTAHMVQDARGKWEPIDFDKDPLQTGPATQG